MEQTLESKHWAAKANSGSLGEERTESRSGPGQALWGTYGPFDLRWLGSVGPTGWACCGVMAVAYSTRSGRPVSWKQLMEAEVRQRAKNLGAKSLMRAPLQGSSPRPRAGGGGSFLEEA